VGLAQTVGSGGGLGLHLRLHPGLWVGRRAGDGAEDQSREDSGKEFCGQVDRQLTPLDGAPGDVA